jgi:hypothetical protein
MKLTLAKFDGDVVGEDVPADPREHPQCVEVFEVPTNGGEPVRVFARPDDYVVPEPSPLYIAYRRAYWRVRAFLNRFVRAWRAF